MATTIPIVSGRNEDWASSSGSCAGTGVAGLEDQLAERGINLRLSKCPRVKHERRDEDAIQESSVHKPSRVWSHLP